MPAAYLKPAVGRMIIIGARMAAIGWPPVGRDVAMSSRNRCSSAARKEYNSAKFPHPNGQALGVLVPGGNAHSASRSCAGKYLPVERPSTDPHFPAQGP